MKLAVFVVVDIDAPDAETARLVGSSVAEAFADTSRDGGVVVGPVRVLAIPGDGETALGNIVALQRTVSAALAQVTPHE